MILYSNDCPKCKILKSKLDEAGIKYEIFNDINKMIELGIRSNPILEINGIKLSFSEAIKWIKDLEGLKYAN